MCQFISGISSEDTYFFWETVAGVKQSLSGYLTRSCSKPFKEDEMLISIYTSSNNAMGEIEKGHFWNEGAY